MAECTFRVPGLDCQVEVEALRAALANAPGAKAVAFDLMGETLHITYEPEVTDPARLRQCILAGAGMRAELLECSNALPVVSTAPRPESGIPRLSRAWFMVLAAALCWFAGQGLMWLAHQPTLAAVCFVLTVLLSVIELLPRCWNSLAHRRLDIHVLMSLAVAGALALGQWDEAATVAFLFLLSEALEEMSVERARRAVRALLEVAPETAELLEPGGSARIVPASSIRPGQRVLVRSGQRVPVDGRVVEGRSSVDQKMITGESVPAFREPGDDVFAGTVNGEGALEVEASRALGDAVITRIVERVRAAQRGRTPIEQTINRFATVYTPLVVVLALALMVLPPLLIPGADGRWWFHQGLVLLVIACPCALVIATPVAVVSALAAAARRGILIKSGQYLEVVGRLRVLAFDKTGTLTRGEPDVVEVVPHGARKGEDLMRVAAAMGNRGGHLLGQAIARHARRLALDVPVADDYLAVPGLGARAQVDAQQCHMGSHRYIDENGLCPPDFHAALGESERAVGTAVAVTTRDGPLGWLRLADRPRPEAAETLATLRRLGITPIMLTGDNAATAAAISRELGITEHQAGLMPEEKATAVAQLETQYGATGMVGDGVNDAPALSAARVSIAMGGIGSGAALETADVVLMGDDLSALPWLVRLSRRTLAIIRANMSLAVGAKLAFMILALLGWANLWMAIAADLGVSLLVVANALRLLDAKEKPGRARTEARAPHRGKP